MLTDASPPLILFMAQCYLQASDWPEVRVYFEARSESEAHARLRGVLAAAWRVPVDMVDYYNLRSEAEHVRDWCDPDDRTGAARLLVNGSDERGRPSYCDPDRVQVFTRPATHQRLLAAMALVEALQVNAALAHSAQASFSANAAAGRK